jgi:hypothetical protein
MKRFLAIILVALPLLMTVGCATYHGAPAAEPGKPIPADSVVIVGKITLDPELVQEWGALDLFVKNAFQRKAFGLLASESKPKLEDMSKADSIVGITWNEYFLAIIPRAELLNWITLYIPLKVVGGLKDDLYMSSPFQIAHQPEDRFIYLGDLVYHFNVTNQLGGKETVLEIKDGYAAAKAKLDGTITDENGKPLSLEKRLPSKVTKLTTEVIETKTTTTYY